jgi:predicted nucleic acid-binding protein
MTLDTNILIAYLNGDNNVISALSQWKKEGRALFVSSVALAETLSYPAITPSDADIIRDFVGETISVPFDNSLAEIAASLRRKYKIRLPDAVVAATALSRNTPIVTRDRQFLKIKEISVILI